MASIASSGSARDGSIVGGELHVRIVSGSKILDSLMHRGSNLSTESRRVKVGHVDQISHTCNTHTHIHTSCTPPLPYQSVHPCRDIQQSMKWCDVVMRSICVMITVQQLWRLYDKTLFFLLGKSN